MRKTICIICIMVMVFSSFALCFADVIGSNVEQVSPRFVATFMHRETLTISSKGYATMTAQLQPKSATSMDEVKVTMTLKKTDGTLIRKKTYDAVWSETAFQFQVSDNKQLSDKGSYYVDMTYKCYKNGTLLETLNGSAADSY